MRNTFTPPTTIAGISRLARNISREKEIPYTAALETAAAIAGFQNYKHAKRAIETAEHSRPLKPLFLTVYWHDRTREEPPVAGRVTAVAMLPEPMHDTLHSLKARGRFLLGGFDLECEDHLRARFDSSSPEVARKKITAAVRELQFCSATGLRRIYRLNQQRKLNFLQALPGRDHDSLWRDAQSGSWLLLDEPYHPRVASKGSERGTWLASHNLVTAAPKWEGLYFPGNSIPHLVAEDELLLSRITQIVERLTTMPAIDWDTHSGHYHTEFVSPQRRACGIRYRARPQPSYRPRNGAKPYGGGPGMPSQWRPEASMSLEQHNALGTILQGLTPFNMHSRAYDGLIRWISTLDDWANFEHPEESHQVLDRLYYRNERSQFSSVEQALQGISKARTLVLAAYNSCRPREGVLSMLDVVEKSLVACQQRQAKKQA